MLLSLTPFSSVKPLCQWVLHQFICGNLLQFICEVLWQFVCEVLLLDYVGNYVKACSIYHVRCYSHELHCRVMDKMCHTQCHWCTMLSPSDCVCKC